MKLKLLALAVLCCAFLIPLLNPTRAFACSCGRSSVQEAFNYSDAVFTGTVVSVREEKRPDANGGSYIAHIYAIEVKETWKGVSSSQVEAVYESDFTTANGLQVSTSCEGRGLGVGQTYLLYSSRSPATGELHGGIDICGRSVEASDAGKDIRELGQLLSTRSQTAMPNSGEAANYWWLVVVGVGAVAVGLFTRRNRGK